MLAELPVLVVHKPPFGAKENAAIREDKIDYMVQRQYVQIWSQRLVDKYHSDFQEECSSQLFEDNTIFDQFPSSPAACLEHEIDDIEHKKSGMFIFDTAIAYMDFRVPSIYSSLQFKCFICALNAASPARVPPVPWVLPAFSSLSLPMSVRIR